MRVWIGWEERSCLYRWRSVDDLFELGRDDGFSYWHNRYMGDKKDASHT